MPKAKRKPPQHQCAANLSIGGVFVCCRPLGHKGKHVVRSEAGLPQDGKPIPFKLEWTGDSRTLYDHMKKY